MKIFALIVASALSVNCLGQMTFESRLSSLVAGSGPPENYVRDEYTGFGDYARSVSGPGGASASQTSSIASDSISFDGFGTGVVRDSSGNSYITATFSIASLSSWTLDGFADISLFASGYFSIVNADTNVTLFQHQILNNTGSFSFSGALAAGRYRYFAQAAAGDGGSASANAVFAVVPAPATFSLLGLGALAFRRRR